MIRTLFTKNRKTLGWGAFLFFMIKGLLWLAIAGWAALG